MKLTHILLALGATVASTHLIAQEAKPPTESVWEIAVSIDKVGSFQKTTLVDLTASERVLAEKMRPAISKLTVDDIDRFVPQAQQLQTILSPVIKLLSTEGSSSEEREQGFRQAGGPDGIRSVIMLRCAFALWNEAQAGNQTVAIEVESLLQKAKKATHSSPIFKGLYLGMPIEDAAKLLSFYYKRPLKVSINDTRAQVMIKNPALEGIPNAELLYQIDVVLASTQPNSRSVSAFCLPSYLVDSMFECGDQDARQFSRNFCEAYHIPQMASEIIDLKTIIGKVVGTQSFYFYRDVAFELRIFDDAAFEKNVDPAVLKAKSIKLISITTQKTGFN